MIDIPKITPKVYSDESRDYQILSKVLSFAFNDAKLNVNSIDSIIDNKEFAQLLAYNVNFRNDHEWDGNLLHIIAKNFKYVMRFKGTLKALEFIINMFLKSKNKTGILKNIEIIDRTVYVYLVTDLVSRNEVDDLIKYLLPVGFNYKIINYSEDASLNETKVIYKDRVQALIYSRLASAISGSISGQDTFISQPATSFEPIDEQHSKFSHISVVEEIENE